MDPDWTSERCLKSLEESIAAEQMREWREQLFKALAVPPGMLAGKNIMPRARRNLPAGVRNRFGKEVE